MSRKSVIILVATILAIIGAIIGIALNRPPNPMIIMTHPQDSVKIVPNDWQSHTFAKDETQVVEVTYAQKYGATITIYCMAVFENEKENKYRCVAPWLGTKEIERTNTNDFQARVIPRSEAPKGATGAEGTKGK